jgi:hypothetical protein
MSGDDRRVVTRDGNHSHAMTDIAIKNVQGSHGDSPTSTWRDAPCMRREGGAIRIPTAR